MHITASKLKFLEVAEYMELKKVDSQGILRDFSVAELDNFLYDEVTLDNILTSAEKQSIIIHELENLRALEQEHTVPGYPMILLYPGQSLCKI